MNPRFSILVASLVLAASNGVFSQTYMDEVVFRLPCTEKVAGMKQDSLPKASVANRLRGKVIDAKSGENLAFVNVYCRDKKNGVNTDFDGKFSLIIDNYQELPDSFEVMVSYVGYRSKSIWIQKQQFPVDHEILVKLEVIEQSIEIMGEIIIIKKKSPFVPPTYDEDLAIPSGEYDQD